MTATTTTSADVIRAATSVARDAADGKLNPAALEAQAVTECRELFSTVVGPGDPAWPLQVEIARGVLALDGVPADELSEWLAVARQRAGEADVDAEPVPEELADADADQLANALAEPDPPELTDAEPDPQPQPDPQPTPPRRADRYDSLAAWPPSRSLLRPL